MIILENIYKIWEILIENKKEEKVMKKEWKICYSNNLMIKEIIHLENTYKF